MKKLCSTANIIEAQLLADLLKQDGIDVLVFNQYALGAMGEIPFTHTYPELWVVNDHDLESVARALEHAARRDAHKSCRGCGEQLAADLLSCWNCGAHQELI
jgi:Putative prokaryotic signal transducing protein